MAAKKCLRVKLWEKVPGAGLQKGASQDGSVAVVQSSALGFQEGNHGDNT
jgi:hypothetical protein